MLLNKERIFFIFNNQLEKVKVKYFLQGQSSQMYKNLSTLETLEWRSTQVMSSQIQMIKKNHFHHLSIAVPIFETTSNFL